MTALGYVQIPDNWGDYVLAATAEKSELISSGAVSLSPALTQRLAGSGSTFNFPFWEDLNQAGTLAGATGGTAATRQTATTNTDINPSAPDSAVQVALRIADAKAWRTVDFQNILAGSDPLDFLLDRVSSYWARHIQDTFIAVLQGVFADNAANDSGDAINNVSAAYSAGGSMEFSKVNFLNTLAKLGDSQRDTSVIMVHSTVYSRMRQAQLIDFIPDGNNNTAIATYGGSHRIIVDDAMPTTASGDGQDYTTWIMGQGAVQLGMWSPEDSLEQDRKPLAYGGSGALDIVSREHYCIHPIGYSFTGSLVNGNAPANSVLDDAGSWDRVFAEQNMVKMLQLVTTESA